MRLLWSVYFAAIWKNEGFFHPRQILFLPLLCLPIYISIVNQEKTLRFLFCRQEKMNSSQQPFNSFSKIVSFAWTAALRKCLIHKSIPTLSSLKSSKTRHTMREGSYENKDCPQMVSINHLTPTQTHIWLFRLLLLTELISQPESYLARSYCSTMRKWVTKRTNARGPSLPHASDEWGTGLPIYLNSKPNSRSDGNIPPSSETPSSW